MSNLYKYIQTINESDNSDKKALLYEKYIYLGFKYLKEKKQKEEQKKEVVELPIPIENIIATTATTEIKELKELIKNYNNIKKPKKKKNDSSQVTTEKNETKVEIENIFNKIKDKVTKISEIDISEEKEVKNKTKVKSIKQYIDDLVKIIKEIDDDEILSNIKNNDNNKQIDDKKDNDYKKSLFICKHFLWHEKQKTSCSGSESCDFKLINFDYQDYKIEEVLHLGGKHQQINEYWIGLYPTNKNPTTTSVGKTDIYLKTNGSEYHLSLKNENAQLATPTFVDIYTLIMHGINMLLEKIKTKDLIDFSGKKEILDLIQAEVSNILKRMNDERRVYIDKLKEQMRITDEKTSEYKTNISIAILLELFFEEMKKFNDYKNIEEKKKHEDNKEQYKEKTVEERIKEYFDKEENKSEIDLLIKKSAKDFAIAFSDIKKISNIDDLKKNEEIKKLLNINSDEDIEKLNKSPKSVLRDIYKLYSVKEKNENIINFLNLKQNFIRNRIKKISTSIDIDELKGYYLKAIIIKFKDDNNSKKELVKFISGKTDESKIFDAIKRLIINKVVNDGVEIITASKEKEYDLAFKIKDINLIANQDFMDFFKEENGDIFEILGEVGKELKNIINQNKKIIKKEIIKEAISGLYKFTGASNDGSYNNKNIATHIFEFNHLKPKHLKVTNIKGKQELERFVNTLKIDKEGVFKFAIKGSDGKSYIALRISAIFSAYDGSNYKDYDIYTEGFIDNLVSKTKEKISNVFDTFKIKILKAKMSLKGKSVKLLNLFGLEVKIDKNMKLPKWIVDKL